jgi:hypothetical protein
VADGRQHGVALKGPPGVQPAELPLRDLLARAALAALDGFTLTGCSKAVARTLHLTGAY